MWVLTVHSCVISHINTTAGTCLTCLSQINPLGRKIQSETVKSVSTKVELFIRKEHLKHFTSKCNSSIVLNMGYVKAHKVFGFIGHKENPRTILLGKL